jgi:outer membrane receptor protein involved in Fe transport
VGYEKAGFSGRVAFFYQSSSLRGIGAVREFDQLNPGFNRLDVSLKQQLTKRFSVFVNANNLTDQREQAVNRRRFEQFGSSSQSWLLNRIYSWTVDLGIKYKF